MATENPLRIPPYNDTAPFASSTSNVAMEDMGLSRNGQRFHGKGRDVVPNRSGSAPPTMESSLLAINNLIFQHNPGIGNISGTVRNSDPAMQSYLAFNDSKANLNFRVHTPPSYGEKQHRGLISVDDGSLNVSQATLSTHHEEFEDDQSPHQPSVDLADHRLPPDENASPMVGSGTADESVDHNFEALHATSISTDRGGILSSSNPSTSSNSSSLPLKFTRKTQPMQSLPKGNQSSKDVDVIESAMRDLSILTHPKEQWYQQGQQSGREKMLQHQVVQQQGNTLQAQSSKSHMGAQGLSSTYPGMNQYIHGPEKPPGEAQPILQSSGFTPPLYASTAAYMTSSNPFYSNLQPSRLYSPQYGVGGYAINSSLVPPFIAGYPPHGAMPMVLDGVSGPNFNIRVPGVYTGGSVLQGTDLQHLNKFYGQFGYPMQPQLTDLSYMQYYQQPYGHVYNMSGQLDPLASGGGVVGNQSSVPETKKVPGGAVLDDRKLHHPITGANMPYQARAGLTSPHYFTGPSNMGVMMQYASTSLANPVLIGSPASGTGSSGGRDDTKFTVGDGRYGAPYPGWQGQRGSENFSDSKVSNFLVELKAGKGRRFELSDIAGNIVEFSADQHGSRFIQQKLETCSAEEKESVFKEVLPFAPKLMTDVFGNYVLQKFFEYGTPEQKKELANQLTGQILLLSLQMYGCRVIQKALEVIELDQKVQLVRELDGHVLRCVRDQNGNHVIQKCIESIPTDKISFIISEFRGHIAELSMHPYGCRVIQRVLEHCTDEIQCQFIVNEIMESVCVLAQDQYGNYVAQHVLERGTSEERSQIISKFSGHIVKLSQHKFASNVVEKCVEFGRTSDRGIILDEILAQTGGNDNLLVMMKDQFANYVVQKILDTCTETQRTLLLNRIKTHVPALKKYTYGKHIVARVEAQFEEDNEDKVQT